MKKSSITPESRPALNLWKYYHNSLYTEQAKQFKARIEHILGICQSAFYRKLADPHRFLTIAEKLAIARVYGLEPVYLFPELEREWPDGKK